MLRDLLRMVGSRLLGLLRRPMAAGDGLTDRYRVVRHPLYFPDFEPLDEKIETSYSFEWMIDPALQSGEAIADAQTYRPCMARLDRGSLLGLTFLPVAGDKSTCLNFYAHNPLNPNQFEVLGEGETVRYVNADTVEGKFSGVDRYDEGVLVGNRENFGHWLYNHLARLALIESAPGLQGVPLVVGENVTAGQVECLRLMGYPDSMILRLRRGRLARFRTLWAPQMLFCGYGARLFWAPGMVDFLRMRLGVRPGARAKPGRRLYVTRRTSQWRRVVNEDEIVALLEARGFEIIDPGTLSIARQIEIASDAEIIMGPFGAGMNLLLFAPGNATVIELKFESVSMDINPMLCHRIGQRYIAVTAMPVDGDHSMNADMLVMPERVRQSLDAAGFGL
jgi:hypothetical protein